MENQRKKSKQEQLKPEPEVEPELPVMDLKTLEQTTQNLAYIRRIEKIKKSIANEEKKPEK
jgi:hypothetical protein